MSHDKYVAPTFTSKAFTCPVCGVYSNFTWHTLKIHPIGAPASPSGIQVAFCSHCHKPTIWMDANQRMIWPQDISAAPLPNRDMPADIRKDYIEARSIAAISSRGAAALYVA